MPKLEEFSYWVELNLVFCNVVLKIMQYLVLLVGNELRELKCHSLYHVSYDYNTLGFSHLLSNNKVLITY